jgi:hypothetical protein
VISGCDRLNPLLADGALDQTDYSGRDFCPGGHADLTCDLQIALVVGNTIRDCTLDDFRDVRGLGAIGNSDGIVSMNAPGLIFSNEISNYAYK